VGVRRADEGVVGPGSAVGGEREVGGVPCADHAEQAGEEGENQDVDRRQRSGLVGAVLDLGTQFGDQGRERRSRGCGAID